MLIDRAHVMRRYQTSGHSSVDVAKLMGLSQRQKNNIMALLKLPEEVQLAIDSDEGNFRTTHALQLKALKDNRYPDLDYVEWVNRIKAEGLSVAQIVREANKQYRKDAEPGFGSIFRQDGTDTNEGWVRLSPIKFNLKTLSDNDKARLRAELEGLLKSL